MTQIVVSVHGPSVAAVTAQVLVAKRQGADLIEVRLDLAAMAGCAVDDLLTAMPTLGLPVLVTARHADEGGAFTGNDAIRLAWYQRADALGARYVDWELAHDETMAWRPLKAALVLSHHDFRGQGGDLPAVVRRMRAAGCAIAKVAISARDAHDLALIHDLYAQAEGPLVAIAMGEHGAPSRQLAGVFAAPFTFARIDGGEGSAPGQPTVKELIEDFALKRQRPGMRILGVIGSPIGHSKSPLMHNAACAALDLDAVYARFRVEDVPAFWHACGHWITGLSVTIPHKEVACTLAQDSEPLAERCGAVNTLWWRDGRVQGANTDAIAITALLRQGLGSVRGRTVLILGAGGVAKGAAHACALEGAEVVITNRTLARAEELAAACGGRAASQDDALGVAYDVIINGTSVGMGAPQDTPWPSAAHRPGSVAFDTVFNPLRTRFLNDAEAAGCRIIHGASMLSTQGEAQFTRFTGIEPPAGVMHRALMARL